MSVSLDGAVRGLPAVAVDVEGVVVVAEREHVPLHEVADLRVEDGRVADERAAVDRHEAELRLEEDDELVVGRSLARRRGSRARRRGRRAIESSIDGEWSW